MANMDTAESSSSPKNCETTVSILSVSRSKLVFRTKNKQAIQDAWDSIDHEGFSIAITEVKKTSIVTAIIQPFTCVLSPKAKPTMAELYMPGFDGDVDSFVEKHFMTIKKAVKKVCCLSILKHKEDGTVYVFLGTDSRAIKRGDGEEAFKSCFKQVSQLLVDNYEKADIRLFPPARKMDEISIAFCEAVAGDKV